MNYNENTNLEERGAEAEMEDSERPDYIIRYK